MAQVMGLGLALTWKPTACACGASLDRRAMVEVAGPWTWPICQECGAEFTKERVKRGKL